MINVNDSNDFNKYKDSLIDFMNNVGSKYGDFISNYFPTEWENLSINLKSFVENYEAKLNEARKLRIGIVGQIKAGKSTFLNCLLFEGRNILPKAVTPMTASLTVLSYCEKPHIEIEFFNENDIKEIERLANQESSNKIYKEILNDIEKTEIKEKIKENIISLEFSNVDNIRDILKDYVSESGKFVNIVKYVSIYIDYEPIRYIEIVDTPGINDPITSRSRKTQEFVESCDILFLLSRSNQFLEISDIDLLAQVYRHKNAKVYVIASRFDSVLDDAISTKKNQVDFNELFNNELGKRKKEFHNHLEKYINSGDIQNDIIDHWLLYFSSAFYKKINNIALSSDEEKPIKKLSERTKNFSLTETHSGFDSISKVIKHYQNEKNANAFKSKIVEDYKNERINSLKNSIKLFKNKILEIIYKKTEDIEKEINQLKEQQNNLIKNKQAISKDIENMYDRYTKEFTNSLKEFYGNQIKKMQDELSIVNLKNRSSRIGYRETKEKIEKSGILSSIARFFNLGGYEEVVIRRKYEYYERDVIIDILESVIYNINKNISNEIRKIFNTNDITLSIMRIFKNYSIPIDLNSINISFEAPQNIGIEKEVAQDIFSAIEKKFSHETTDSSIFDYIERTIIDLIDFAKDNIKTLEKSIKIQTKNQVNKLMTLIENYYNDKIQLFTNRSNLKEEEVEELNNKSKSFLDELDNLKRVINFQ